MIIKNGKWICPICDTENSCKNNADNCPACGYKLTSSEKNTVQNNVSEKAVKPAPVPAKREPLKSATSSVTTKKLAKSDYKESIYIQACNMLEAATSYRSEYDYKDAIRQFSRIKDYKDSAAKLDVCLKKLNDTIYENAKILFDSKRYSEAKKEFKKVEDYKDSRNKLSEIIKFENTEKQNSDMYRSAKVSMNDGDFVRALLMLKQIEHYKDSDKLIEQCKTNLKYIEIEKNKKRLKYGFVVLLFVLQIVLFKLFSMYLNHDEFMVSLANGIFGEDFYPNEDIWYDVFGCFAVLLLSLIIDFILNLILKNRTKLFAIIYVVDIAAELFVFKGGFNNIHGFDITVIINILPLLACTVIFLLLRKLLLLWNNNK